MNDMIFRINYYFEGTWNGLMKFLGKRRFMKMRNKWVNKVNGRYESINKAFNTLHPNAVIEPGSKVEKEYLAFVADRLKPYNVKHGMFEGFSDPRTGDFAIRIVGTNNIMSYDMTPVRR